jgi:hypothetical protein
VLLFGVPIFGSLPLSAFLSTLFIAANLAIVPVARGFF